MREFKAAAQHNRPREVLRILFGRLDIPLDWCRDRHVTGVIGLKRPRSFPGPDGDSVIAGHIREQHYTSN